MITATTDIRFTEKQRAHHECCETAKGLWREGRSEDAIAVLDAVLSRDGDGPHAVRSWISRASYCSSAGRFHEALEALRRAASHIDAETDYVKGTFFNERGRAAKALGDLESSSIDYAGAAILFESAGHREYQARAILNVAGLHLSLSNLSEAESFARKSIAIFEEIKADCLSQGYDTLANIYLAQGLIEKALRTVDHAIGIEAVNEEHLQTCRATREKVRTKLLDLLEVHEVGDLEEIRIGMVHRALVSAGGVSNLAAQMVGLTRRGVDYLIDYRPELVEFRKPRRVRRRGIIKH